MRRLSGLAIVYLNLFLAAFGAAAQVTLPLEKFENLRARANPSPDDAPPPPAPYALESADFDVRAGDTSARVIQRLTLTLYAPGWQKVPLGEAGSFIAADLGRLEGRVAADGSGLSLEVRGSGRHEVRLESVMPLVRDETATRPTWRLRLRPPAAAVVRGRLAAPTQVEEVLIEGTGLAHRLDGGGWSFVAAPSAPLGITLAGKRTLPEKARLPLRFEATSATGVTLSRTRLRARGWIEARVAQGRLPELRVPVPQGLEVVSVEGPVAGWDVADGVLVITPLEPVESTLQVEVELAGEPRDAFATPLLVPQGSSRTLYFAKAALEGDGLLELADPGAVRQPEEREVLAIPPGFREADGRAVALLDPARPPHWRAQWADRTEVLAAQVDRLLVDVAVGESGRASYQLWAEIRNRGSQQLVVTLPGGFELAEGVRDGTPITAGATGDGLAVPLRAAEEAQVVYIAGLLPLALPTGKGELMVPLPALSAPAARIEVRLVLPGGGRSYALADSSRDGVIGAPPRVIVSSDRPPSSQIARQLFARRAVLADDDEPVLFYRPPGFFVMTAAWSALTAAPDPLMVRVEKEKERLEWF
ncbi:MAG TPA: hypothetical protein VEL74_13575 [Thermoanaerobaculia bacterium]|nr:hypothetical protein [Thermoanaerobaculia bacterium]